MTKRHLIIINFLTVGINRTHLNSKNLMNYTKRISVKLFHEILKKERALGVFVSLTIPFSLCSAKAGNEIKNDTTLQGKDIPEVVVKGREIVVKDDKLLIYLSNKIKKQSFDGYSALSLLSIPGLSIDPIEETVSTNGEATMLCINGREVSKDEIKTLFPKDIIRIDYYQQHDPNHPMAKSVIDFIVKIRESGGMVMAQANQNLNKASGNDLADWKFFNKKSQFNIQLTGKYNHFTPSRGTESYTLMPFPDGNIEKSISTKPSAIHANNIGVKLAYLYNGKKSKLHIAASLRNNHSAKGTLQEQTITGFGTIESKDLRHNDNISPAFTLYYKNMFSKKLSLEAKINANYNHTNQWRDYMAIEKYLTNSKEDYYYVNPTITVNYKPNSRIGSYFSATYHYRHSNNTYIENGLPTENNLSEGQALFIEGASMQIVPKKFRIGTQFMERIQTIDTGLWAYTKAYLTPSVYYNLSPSKNLSLFGTAYSGVTSPEMKYYNSGERRIDEYQVLAGSSEQKMGRLFATEHAFNGHYKWGGFQLFMRYENNQKEIYEDIYLDEKRKLYVHQFLNGGTFEKFDIVGSINLNIIPNKLKFLYASQYKHIKQRIGYLNTTEVWINTADLTYYDKGWQCIMRYVSPRKGLDIDGSIIKYPQQFTISCGYTSGSWSFLFNAKNPGIKVSQRNELFRHGYTSISDSYNPRNDYSMFSMRVSYRFTYGKKHKYQDVEIDETSGSAILDTCAK